MHKNKLIIFCIVMVLALAFAASAFAGQSASVYIVQMKFKSPEGVANSFVHYKSQWLSEKQIKSRLWNYTIPYAEEILLTSLPGYDGLYLPDENSKTSGMKFTRNGQHFSLKIKVYNEQGTAARDVARLVSSNDNVEEARLIDFW